MFRTAKYAFLGLLILGLYSCGESAGTSGQTGVQIQPFESFEKANIILRGEDGHGSWEACFENVIIGDDEELILGFDARIDSNTVGGNYPVMQLRVNNRDVTGDQMIWDGPVNDLGLPCYRFPQSGNPDRCHKIPFEDIRAKFTCNDSEGEVFEVYDSLTPYKNLFLLAYSPDFESHMEPELPDEMLLPLDSHGGELQPNGWFVGDDINPYAFEFTIPKSWVSETKNLCLYLTNPVKEHPLYWQCQIIMGNHPILDDVVARGDIMIRDLTLKRKKK